MKELEKQFQETMCTAGIHLRYCGETTSVEYDKMFRAWLTGYRSGLAQSAKT